MLLDKITAVMAIFRISHPSISETVIITLESTIALYLRDDGNIFRKQIYEIEFICRSEISAQKKQFVRLS